MSDDKIKNYTWACAMIREAMEACTYGSLTFSMQNGVIGFAKTEVVTKPLIDSSRANN